MWKRWEARQGSKLDTTRLAGLPVLKFGLIHYSMLGGACSDASARGLSVGLNKLCFFIYPFCFSFLLIFVSYFALNFTYFSAFFAQHYLRKDQW